MASSFDEPKTWEEWKAVGCVVIKGQKACGRNKEGNAVFNVQQVVNLDEYFSDDDIWPPFLY